MSREWSTMLQMATTIDGICGNAKWPALVFDSYQSARDWMVDVTPLENLKPVLDVEDCVLFYFGRCSGQPVTRPEDVLHIAIMPRTRASLSAFTPSVDNVDPLLALAFKEAREFAEATSKLRAMEALVRFIIQDSSYALPGDDEEDNTIDWNEIFESLWYMLEADGWGVLKFNDKLAYSIPSVEFSTFEVGKTVLQSKRLALKKAIEYYASTSCPTSDALWDAVWTQMEQRKQSRMMLMQRIPCFLTPLVDDLSQLVPGKTMFSTKKDAVLQFSRRIPDSTPKKKPKRVLLPPSPVAPTHPTTNNETTVVLDDQGMAEPVVAPRRTLKRKMPLQPVRAPVYVEKAATTNPRRVASSAYPWGLVWDILSKDYSWTYKGGKFGFDFHSPDGIVFETEESVMEYLVATDMVGEVDRLIKLHGAPTPDQNKENTSLNVLVNGTNDVTSHTTAKKQTTKTNQPQEEYDDLVHQVVPTKGLRKAKTLQPKKRLSYSTPKKHNDGSRRLEAKSARNARFDVVSFGQIERVLKDSGWKWVSGSMGYVYCKPHVVVGNKGKTLSGKENVDYFSTKEAFECYVRANNDLMRVIYGAIHGTPVQPSPDVFDMSSDEELVTKVQVGHTTKPVEVQAHQQRKPKSKKAPPVVFDEEDMVVVRKKDAGSSTRTIKPSKWLLDEDHHHHGVPDFKVQFANVYKILQQKGWTHRVGMFGYDYYRPNTTAANKKLNETFYHSEADMEAHLKHTGEWNKIADYLVLQHERAQARLSSPSSMSSSSDVASPDGSTAVASPPPVGLFCRMWRRLEDNGWTKIAPNDMEGVYLYSSPNGTRFKKEELQLHDVEALIAEHKKTDVVELNDSSDSDDMQNDEGQHDNDNDDNGGMSEADKDPIDPAHPSPLETPGLRPAAAATAASESTYFLSPEESTVKTDKVVARNVQQDFTPSPSDATSSSKGVDVPPTSPSKKRLFRVEMERVLHNLGPGFTTDAAPLLHRAPEWQALVNFVDTCITTGQRKSMFVSGAPGSGKSALMKAMEQHVATAWTACKTSLQVINLNAMSLGDAASVYKAIAAQVTNKECSTAEQATDALSLAFKSTHRTTFLILDEIDVLLQGKGERDLYQLFEWAHHPFSSVIFVGIANSIDLTERCLPLLKSNDCKPVSVVFAPYSFDAIFDILKQRVVVGSLTPKPVVDVMAMSYLARKMASTSGDIRTCLSICKASLLAHQANDCHVPVTLQDMVQVMKTNMNAPTASHWQSLPRMTQ
ncbi:hypothetical protein DYB36_004344, partial [Aphanomyces astaci]